MTHHDKNERSEISHLQKYSSHLLHHSKLNSDVSFILFSYLYLRYKSRQEFKNIPKIFFPGPLWPHIVNWKKFETSYTLLAIHSNWVTEQEGPWSGGWPKTQRLLWQSFRSPLQTWGNLLVRRPSQQLSINQNVMSDWLEGSHFELKAYDSLLWVC